MAETTRDSASELPAVTSSSSALPASSPPPTFAFKRRLLVPGVVLGLAELVGIAYPLWSAFELRDVPRDTLLPAVLPVAVAACIVWFAALTSWMLPLRNAVVARRRGERVNKELAARAYRITLRAPVRILLLRTGLWGAAATLMGVFLHLYTSPQVWPWARVAQLAAVASVHAYIVSCIRAVWWAQILGDIRALLFAAGSPLRKFDENHFRRFMLVAMTVAGGILFAQAAFSYYFVLTTEQYLKLQTFYPIAAAVALGVWALFARAFTYDLRRYLAVSRGETIADAPPAAVIYRRAQALPYRFALLTICVWFVIALTGALLARFVLDFDLDDTLVIAIATSILTIAGAIYEQLWHRDILRPLLAHLTHRYRVPVRNIAPSLSLRSKLLLSFGGVVLLACGMALLWGFVQYKKLATDAAERQSTLGLRWVHSELQTEIAALDRPPTPDAVRTSLRRIATAAPEAPVLYYIDPVGDVLGVGGVPVGAPILPWYASAQLQRIRGSVTLGPSQLTGRAATLALSWRGTVYGLGSVAVFYPSYRGRGENMVRPLRELLLFFLVLFGACGGIVAFTVAQFMAPIRRLEQRADAMARGELADPVASGGEGDEIGRLTLALEEMRRALRDKLRSTEEVNLDLERAVQMRTADLARKNRELAETLDKLTRAQQQLVRSEKLASIGQLVAGIAHEINNPVNAIVNTVGPLEEAINEIDSADEKSRTEAAKDVRDMVRVVQRGAQRTKAIVSALHNYSRTDDESVVDFDVDRSIEDSLELLRHLLKQNITVHKKFGAPGKIRGHAGQVNQVFMNLMTNAAQALTNREGSTITIETSGDAEKVVVRIGDNGPGIPADVLPRIFDPFFTTKDVGEGTGLGLSIVHELVERHGGTIEVDTKLGDGTAFIVTLPRLAPSAQPKRAS
ncbi:MAG TPA: ATP-binding protein [Kofleriaceae bacterium]|jgi:signal transduction histidine kinase